MFKNIVVLTGAGISAESGIPVFRSETGLWEQERVEDVATYEGYARNPAKVHEFYNKMRRSLKERKPNPAHLALSRLEQEWQQGEVTVVTQNIDDLHEKAGSNNIIHMHGELRSAWCEHCDEHYPWEDDTSAATVCPKCNVKGKVRPDIVWFGEMPYQMGRISEKLNACDLFLSVGTSGVVYPAAGFCQIARAAGALCVEFNLEHSAGFSSFNYGLYGKASQTLTEFVDHLLKTGEALDKV
ncbi:MAG: NAD-dependent deacylase [Succinivibrio sp.]|nr:NAD-dependent deacylase [Succinivibrio sp.]